VTQQTVGLEPKPTNGACPPIRVLLKVVAVSQPAATAFQPSDGSPRKPNHYGAMSASLMTTAAVSIDGISKRYRLKRRNVVALDDVTLSIAAGECVAIAGVNGAGKTTLLRCLLDFAQPDAGEIRVFGIDSRRTEARRAIAFLPERFLPSPHLTGAETLAMMAGLQDQTWPRDRVDRALGELEFPAEALDRRMREYSKGMTQKLGLASAILQDKPLMVLDEPMSGLDPQARRFLTGVLARLRAQGTGLIFTSHAPADIERLADRVALLDAGRLLFFGTPADLRSQESAADLESAFLSRIQPGGNPSWSTTNRSI